MLQRDADMMGTCGFQEVNEQEAAEYAVMKAWYLSQKYPNDLLDRVQRNDNQMMRENTVFAVQLLLRSNTINESNIENVA